jgi:hypothetical protein
MTFHFSRAPSKLLTGPYHVILSFYFYFLRQGLCTFERKVYAAKRAYGAKAVLIYDLPSES